MKLRYTPAAIQDLREIEACIRDVLQNPRAASRIGRAILDDCKTLKEHPLSGPSLEEKTGYHTDLRMLISGRYLAMYRVEEDTVSVARILDGRRDYMRILLREDELRPEDT